MKSPGPVPRQSAGLTLRLSERRDIDRLKRLLEAWDNLGYQTTLAVDQGLVRLVCAPGQKAELGMFLKHSAGMLSSFCIADEFAPKGEQNSLTHNKDAQ